MTDLVLGVDPRRDHLRGSSTAPLMLVEYGDFECPACGAAYFELEHVRERMGGQLCFVFRHFPLSRIHPHAVQAAEAAEAAAEQDKFWQMHDMLYENRDTLELWDLARFARRLRLDTHAAEEAITTNRYLPRIQQDFRSGVRSGVNGTPTLFINGNRHDGGWDSTTLIATLERTLDGRDAVRTW